MKSQTAHLRPLIADLKTKEDALGKARALRDERTRHRASAKQTLPQLRRDLTKLLSRQELGENVPPAEIEAARKAIANQEALLTDDAVTAATEIVEDRRAEFSEAVDALSSAFTPLLNELRSQVATEVDELIFKLQLLYSRYEALSIGNEIALDIRMPTLGDVRRPPSASKSEAEIDPALREALDAFARALRIIGRS